METKLEKIRFKAGESAGNVSALVMIPDNATAMLVFAHGAGAGMAHPFMTAACTALAEHGVATFRYQFPYMEGNSRRPDPKPVLHATVREAVTTARAHAGDLPLFAGGKSMGGRMTSEAEATEPLGVSGILFYGFPLHPPGKPSTGRAAHVADVAVPMLFLQGTRDTLAEISLIQNVTAQLGAASTLHIVNGADHSFHVLKSSGRTDAEVLEEVTQTAAGWMKGRI